MAQPATAAPQIEPAGLITIAAALERFPIGNTSLRDHIRKGNLDAVRFRGKLYIRPEDVEAVLAPRPVVVSEESLRSWAQRMAAKAPAFRPEQRDVIVSAFSSALSTGGAK